MLSALDVYFGVEMRKVGRVDKALKAVLLDSDTRFKTKDGSETPLAIMCYNDVAMSCHIRVLDAEFVDEVGERGVSLSQQGK